MRTSAGARSTEKYIGALLAEGLRVKVVGLPGGLDPDEYIQQNGVEAYRKQLDGAASYFHWLADAAHARRFDMRSAEGRVDAFKSIAACDSTGHDPLERGAIAKRLQNYLNVDRDVVRENVRKRPHSQASCKDRRNRHLRFLRMKSCCLVCLLLSADARVGKRISQPDGADACARIEKHLRSRACDWQRRRQSFR